MSDLTNISCGYAKFKAIGFLIGSIIFGIFFCIFGFLTILGKIKVRKVKSSKTTNEDSDKKEKGPKPVPSWIGYLMILVGPVLTTIGFVYYKFISKHRDICASIGMYSAATDTGNFLTKIFR